MQLKFLKSDFSICQLRDLSKFDIAASFCFLAKTPDEISLVCLTEDVPENICRVEHGWRAFRIEGTLDFSLVGILSRISCILALRDISIFAISTFNTDYILIKKDAVEEAKEALRENDYEIN